MKLKSFLLNVVALSAPQVTVPGKFIRIEMSGGPGSLGQVKLDFDEDIYIVNNSNSSERYRMDDPLLAKVTPSQRGDSFPFIFGLANSFITNCTDQNGNNQTLIPLTSSYLTPSTDNPVQTILTIMSRGLNLPTTYYPRRIAVVVALGEEDFASCTWSRNPAADYSFQNAEGDYVPTFTATPGPPPACTAANAAALDTLVRDIYNTALTFNDTKQIGQIQSLFDIIRAGEAWIGCEAYTKTLLQFTNVNVSTPLTTQCRKRYDDPSWQTDPCCNHEAAMTQCCAPSGGFMNARSGVPNAANISTHCSNPEKVTTLLSLAVAANAARESQVSNNIDELFQDYTKFYSTCQDAVFQSRCTVDSDCPYTGSCNANIGRCEVDWFNIGPAIIKCYLVKMPPELKTRIKKNLRLPVTYPSLELEVAEMKDVVLNISSSVDCVGPSAWEAQGRYTFEVDSDGNYRAVWQEGNSTLCELEQQCNYESWSRRTAQECLADDLTGFCRQTTGWKPSVSRPSVCSLSTPYQDSNFTSLSGDIPVGLQATCNAISGTVRGSNGNYQCYLNDKQSNSTECFKDALCDTGRTDDNRCSESVCRYGAANQSVCANYGGSWRNNLGENGTCVIDLDYGTCVSTEYDGQPLSWSSGRNFYQGRFDTAETCPESTCEFLREDPANEEKCLNNFQCTQPCSRCRTWSHPTGACYNNSILSQAECASGGQWNSPGPTSVGSTACIFNSFNSTECVRNGLTWADPDLIRTKADCLELPVGMNPTWNQWDACLNEEDCIAGGQCDDWEFGGNEKDGACTYVPERQFNCKFGETFFQNTRDGRCIDSRFTNSSSCIQQAGNYTWKARAKTKDACLAQGNSCLMLNGQRNYINKTLCDACGGESRPIYNWQEPRWIAGKMVPTEWVPYVRMESVNSWQSTLSWERLNKLFSSGVAEIIRDKMMSEFLQNYGLFAKVFKYVGCDCADPSANCFNGLISSRVGTCQVDPSVPGSCLGVKFGDSAFNSTNVISGAATVYSTANFVGTSNSNNLAKRGRFLSKRDTSGIYDVVKNGDGTIIGQIVGNALGFEFDTAATGAITICLEIDVGITQNTVEYPNLDFSEVIDGNVTLPIQANVTADGTQFCGSVPGFLSATFIPIRRSSALIVANASAVDTATATNSVGSSSTSTSYIGSVSTVFVASSSTATATATQTPSSGKQQRFSFAVNLLCFMISVMFI